MTLAFGLRRHTALSRACKARSVVMRDCMDHPMTRLENRSMTTDRYDHPSWVLIYVMSVTQTVSGHLPQTAGPACCRRRPQVCHHIDQGGVCSQSAPLCPLSWPTAQHGSQSKSHLVQEIIMQLVVSIYFAAICPCLLNQVSLPGVFKRTLA